ncbi:hypothetical protein AAFN85_15335 [Mucilaginibacter sp. CAU 1740]|uniref:hypothetical protein n=1 Tax=Mucilaginibacter sp. CAU 1740 TaxID=3140365 RepID=UPI00325B6DC7
MINEFSLNTNSPNQLIAEISDAIVKYYPIGIDNFDPAYSEYPGFVEQTKIVNENMMNYKRSFKPWNDFLKKVRTGTTKKVHNSGFPHEIAFSGELIVQRNSYKSVKHTKKIVFSVSMLAPLFSVFGIDETFIPAYDDTLQRELTYSAINVVTTSPYQEFESGFNYIMQLIQEQFPNHKFVAFQLTQRFVKGLHTPDNHTSKARVHNALFNGLFNFSPDTIFTKGDRFFGLEKGNTKAVLLPPAPTD